MAQVRIGITLPAAPQQHAQHLKRVVVVTVAGVSQPSFEVGPEVTVLPALVADIGATLQVSVAEHLVNGKSAVCQSPVVNPADHVEAVAADPTGFVFKVTPLVVDSTEQGAPNQESTPVQPSPAVATVAAEPQPQIDPGTGRVVPHL